MFCWEIRSVSLINFELDLVLSIESTSITSIVRKANAVNRFMCTKFLGQRSFLDFVLSSLVSFSIKKKEESNSNQILRSEQNDDWQNEWNHRDDITTYSYYVYVDQMALLFWKINRKELDWKLYFKILLTKLEFYFRSFCCFTSMLQVVVHRLSDLLHAE
jgi:hypothetical protein